jgi:hypothetical protein
MKRFGQKCCPEWFFYGVCGVTEVVIRSVDVFGNNQFAKAATANSCLPDPAQEMSPREAVPSLVPAAIRPHVT